MEQTMIVPGKAAVMGMTVEDEYGPYGHIKVNPEKDFSEKLTSHEEQMKDLLLLGFTTEEVRDAVNLTARFVTEYLVDSPHLDTPHPVCDSWLANFKEFHPEFEVKNMPRMYWTNAFGLVLERKQRPRVKSYKFEVDKVIAPELSLEYKALLVTGVATLQARKVDYKVQAEFAVEVVPDENGRMLIRHYEIYPR